LTVDIIAKPKIKFLVLSLFLFTHHAYAQLRYEVMKTKYPDENYVLLLSETDLQIDNTGDSLVVIRTSTERGIHLNENMQSTKMQSSVSHSGFYKLTDIKAATYLPKGKPGKYKKKKVKYFMNSADRDYSIFHDDSKEMVFLFDHLKPGAEVEKWHKINVTEPRLLGLMTFQAGVPIEKAVYRVTFPSTVKVGYKTFHKEILDLRFKETKNGDYTTYEWTASSIPKVEFEDGAPDFRYYVPQIHVYVEEAEFITGKEKFVGTVDNLYGWYSSLVSDYDEKDGRRELKELVDSIVVGLEEEEEKVKHIYSWVQNNIRYVAFEDHLGGFIPRPAGLVCERRFGDCKDMSSILVAMLEEAGIKAHLTWIGTRHIPFTYEELPTPSVDNHMIATYFNKDNEAIFLDGTVNHINYGTPPDHIQGKEALIQMSEDEYKILKVPVQPKEYSQFRDSAAMTIVNNSLVGEGSMEVSGYNDVYFITRYNYTPVKERAAAIKDLSMKGSNKYRLEGYELSQNETADTATQVKYTFKLEDHITQYEDEMYVNMNLYTGLGKKIDEDRELAFEYDFFELESRKFILEIPDGYQVNHLPENFEASDCGFAFKLSYTVKDNKIIYQLRMETETLMLEKKDFDKWNAMYTDLFNQFNESVVLKKT
jgi:hypothetical protein